jgi:DNA-directed RNA polymerase specialized sigma24 family protein
MSGLDERKNLSVTQGTVQVQSSAGTSCPSRRTLGPVGQGRKEGCPTFVDRQALQIREGCLSADLSPTARALRPSNEWLDAPELNRIAAAVSAHFGLSAYDRAEVLQETRIALWTARASPGVSASWIFRVATNKAVQLMRRTTRYREGDRSFASLASGRSPEPELEYLLHARVAHLPGRLRRFYELRYVAGWSERELARRLGMCRASIRWLDGCCQRAIVGRSSTSEHGARRFSRRGAVRSSEIAR